MEEAYDLIVLGAGPGGYVAAIRAALEGKRVALIEKEMVGGVCLNWGCIPTKTLLAHAQRWHEVQNAQLFGIEIQGASFDYSKMVGRKDAILSRMQKSLEGLIASHKVKLLKGKGSFISSTEVRVEGIGTVRAPKVIIATGSQTRQVPPFVIDGRQIHDSSTILQMQQLPKSLIVVGGGVIGCEFATLFKEFGVQVTILEMMPALLPTEAKVVSTHLAQAMTRKGIQIKTGVEVVGCQLQEGEVQLELKTGEKLQAETVLVAVGRQLNTEGLGLEKAGVKLSPKGAIEVNEQMQTNVSSIYAIGDVTAKRMLAHVASHQGMVAALHASGHLEAKIDYSAVPNVIFTTPEIATVGLSLEEAEAKGLPATVGRFPFLALGKAVAIGQTDGFAQVVIDRNTHQILGAQVVGVEAANLIAPMVFAIQHELTADSIVETIHAHPTLAEGWLEATLLALDKPIHLPPKAK